MEDDQGRDADSSRGEVFAKLCKVGLVDLGLVAGRSDLDLDLVVVDDMDAHARAGEEISAESHAKLRGLSASFHEGGVLDDGAQQGRVERGSCPLPAHAWRHVARLRARRLRPHRTGIVVLNWHSRS